MEIFRNIQQENPEIPIACGFTTFGNGSGHAIYHLEFKADLSDFHGHTRSAEIVYNNLKLKKFLDSLHRHLPEKRSLF